MHSRRTCSRAHTHGTCVHTLSLARPPAMLLPGRGAGLSWVLTAVRGPPASSFPEREPDSGLGRAQPHGAACVQAGAAQVSLTFLIVTEAPVTLPSSALPSQPHVHTHTYLVHTCARTLTFTGPCFQPEPQPPAWAGQRASERVHSQLVAFRQEEGASMCNASWLGVPARGREASRVAEQRPVTCVTCLGVRAPWSAPQPRPSVTGAERPWPCRSGLMLVARAHPGPPRPCDTLGTDSQAQLCTPTSHDLQQAARCLLVPKRPRVPPQSPTRLLPSTWGPSLETLCAAGDPAGSEGRSGPCRWALVDCAVPRGSHRLPVAGALRLRRRGGAGVTHGAER